MKKLIKKLFFLPIMAFVMFVLQNCNVTSTDDKVRLMNSENRLSTDFQVDSVFSNYIQIEDYKIWVAFPHKDIHKSPPSEDNTVKWVSYSYAYPNAGDNINCLYAVEVCELKNEPSFKDDVSKIDFYANRIETDLSNRVNGVLIKKKYNIAKDTLIQKIKFEFPNQGEMYCTSSFFIHNDRLVIRMYSFSFKEADNKQTNSFFKTIRYNLEKK